MTLEEWEAAGLAIAQRAYTFIQKIIAHRRAKAALFEAVERVADERAEMLEEREEGLKEKAREVRRRGRSLLEDSF
ncbi:hypothetical protein SAICODRAFT_31168 [Saitoella complicata NRRL Y-17804]|uniref:uncharacterized protein n=1 Tax=Saitoella complicata (strain BCRC 22490 / CBS 7301 / JCM 7358 / NBRC 10748 / NRRL Y-17804) TaxID=698492 RepID=UPI0008674E94|nr:uncharacterized protein SAICODRAFT_31168 [Saitoella complicata NRRL Y-17804]ODQ51481.1 hypothetical protein SAICODRAFT_31168 [Saitoella complicata NRRL Y-17804]